MGVRRRVCVHIALGTKLEFQYKRQARLGLSVRLSLLDCLHRPRLICQRCLLRIFLCHFCSLLLRVYCSVLPVFHHATSVLVVSTPSVATQCRPYFPRFYISRKCRLSFRSSTIPFFPFFCIGLEYFARIPHPRSASANCFLGAMLEIRKR